MSNENFAVFNALNLINKKLGNLYLEKGFNPFSDDYVLSAEGAEKLLNINIQKKFVESPTFMEESAFKVSKKLVLAQKRAEELLLQFKALIDKGNASKKMLEELIYIKICTELLKGLDLKNLNYEEIVEVIKTIVAMSPEYSVVFRRVFDKDFDVQIAITDFIKLCKIAKTKKVSKSQEDLKNLVHREYTQQALHERPKQNKKSNEKEIEK